MKLWDKGQQTEKRIEAFTVGNDRQLDHQLAKYDIWGTLAHIQMLSAIELLTKAEHKVLKDELLQLYQTIEAGDFHIQEEVEDVHSQVEFLLIRTLGDIGKKIHSGRSRNDQVLVDLKLFFRAEIRELVHLMHTLLEVCISQSETYKESLLPGYTHMQVAMPSSFGLWFGAYAESIAEDLLLFLSAYQMADQNPLGSAAGYGSSFPLQRKLTTELLGFRTLSFNVVNAQMGRGKTERAFSFALANLAGTLNKLASDVCLYMGQNMKFLSLPDELTTGSSIMPHKKNPDVFEIMRAKTNRIQNLPNELSLMLTNLPSGYHRDLQLTKEALLPAIKEMKDILSTAIFAIKHIKVRENILQDPLYDYLFSVDVVNQKVLAGNSFRDAYREVAAEIENGTFKAAKNVNHTHEGSIGNLCLEEIRQKFEDTFQLFHFEHAEKAIQHLLQSSQ